LFAYRRTSLLPCKSTRVSLIFSASSLRRFCVHIIRLLLYHFSKFTYPHTAFSLITLPSFSPTCRILSGSVRISNILPLTIMKSMVSFLTQSVQYVHTLANGISSTQIQFFLYTTHSEHMLNTSYHCSSHL
jgi:hypothetical protein